MKNKKIILFFIISICALFLAACQKNTTSVSDSSIEIEDAEGIKKITKKPKRTALLYPSYGDIWTKCGGSIEIGVEDNVTRGYAKEDMVVVGSGTGKDINLEALVASQPDFVILALDFPNHQEIAKSLKNYGISYGIFECRDFTDYLHILEVFSNILDNSEALTTYGTIQKNVIASIINARNESDYCPKVLLLRATSSSLKALGNTNFVGQMINELHAQNIADSNTSLTADLSKEIILKENPDIILVVPMGEPEVVFNFAKKKLADETYQSLSAIKNNAVYYMDKDLFHYKPNTRWGEAYEILAGYLSK